MMLKIKEIRHNYVKKLGINFELRNVLRKGRLIPNSLNIPINATQKIVAKINHLKKNITTSIEI